MEFSASISVASTTKSRVVRSTWSARSNDLEEPLTYRAVVDRFAYPVALDPPSAALFVLAFVVAAALTARRPVYGLAALVLTTPIAFAHNALGTTITVPKAVLLGVLLGLATYSASAPLLRKPPAPLLLGALALLFFVTTLTLLDAAHRGAVVREALKVAEYAATFVAAFLCYALDPQDAPLVGAASIAAIFVALSALAQEIIGAPSGLYIGSAIVPRIAGLLEGPNQLAGYCEIAVATLGAWAFVRRSPLLDAALALTVFADVLTFSRAGWGGLAVVVVVLALVGGKRTWQALRPGLLGLIAGALGAVWWAIYAHSPAVLRASLEGSFYAGGVGNRDELWRAAWKMWLGRPILGVGAGNFELSLPAYGLFGVRTHANSWYLQSLAEGGILLFSATLAVLAAILASLTEFRPLRRLRAASPWVVAALAATVALALHQVADYLVFYPKVGGAWWLLVGIAAAALSAASS
ncbi:MAG: O-antigen ligase family protein [Candidatus Cybelea sp.]